MSSNYSRLNGTHINWNRTGDGKPLLFLHGWGSNCQSFYPVLKKLETVRSCYLPDFPGFGNSEAPSKPWTVSDFADIIEKFIEKHLPEGSFDILAHSFGARVAIKLLNRPALSERIDKVIFTGAAGLKPKRSLSFYIRKYTAILLKMPFLLLPKMLREKGLHWLRNTSLWKKLGSSDYQKLGGVMRQTFIHVVSEHQEKELSNIPHEILLLWGKNDTATPPEQGERMNSILKHSAFVPIEHAGHYAFIDKPAQFAAIAIAYLEPDV